VLDNPTPSLATEPVLPSNRVGQRGTRRPWPKTFIAGIAIVGFLLICALVPDWLLPYDPIGFDYGALLEPPSLAHPFGTDQFGRDVLSRTISAARIDLEIALFATIFPMIIGAIIGLLVGYVGGFADIVFGRLVDLVVTFPFLVIIIAIVAVLGPGLTNMYIAVGVVGWVFYGRLMRSEVLVQAQSDYVAASRVLGFRPSRILLRHILPNCARPILAYWVTDMALAILLGSSLGYLGLGAQPPAAEWGVLVADGKNYFSQAPWIAFFPGLAAVICGMGFSLAGDGLGDLLDVKR
jgi:peptide/nickel transport system permease protein